MSTEFREALAAHLGHRINIRGTVYEVRDDQKGTRVCIHDPEMEDVVLCRHVWVLDKTVDWHGKEGGQVSFTAVVRDYQSEHGRNYCLRNVSDFKLISPPAFKPSPAPITPSTLVCEDKPMLDHIANGTSKPPETDPLALLRQAKMFVKEVGGLEQAAKIARALEGVTIPVPQLVQWIAALAEE